MRMEAIIKKVGEPFPKIMKRRGGSMLVVFTGPCCGTVVIARAKGLMGQYSGTWDMDQFVDIDIDFVFDKEEKEAAATTKKVPETLPSKDETVDMEINGVMFPILKAHEEKMRSLGVWEKWLSNMEKQEPAHLGDFRRFGCLNSFGAFICCTIIWDFTPEGYDFWSKIAAS